MNRKFQTVLGIILGTAVLAQAQSPQVAPTPVVAPLQQGAVVHNVSPWVVSVVHKIEVRKVIRRMRQNPNTRIGVPGSMPEYVFNFATGIILDDKGHVVTRLSNIDPEDKDQSISIVTNQGAKLAAKFIGMDCPSGFTVLEVAGLQATLPPVAPSAPKENEVVQIVSADVAAVAAGGQNKKDVILSPSMRSFSGRIEANNPYARLRGALGLRSPNFMSRNDGAIVTTSDNRLVGLAQFAGHGRAYLFPINLIRETIARRVIETQKSVPSAWLGVTGVNLFQLSPEESKGLSADQRSGIFVKEVNGESPAAKSGVKTQDVIVGFNDFNITNTGELGALLSSSPSGMPVKLRAVREGKPLEFDVVLGAKDYAAPALSLHEINVPAPSQESVLAELYRRLAELGGPYNKLKAEPKSPQRDEALSELTIEIREIQDSIRETQRALGTVATAPAIAPPFNSGQAPRSCQLASGFTASELTSQLAQVWGTPRSVWVKDVKKGSPADLAGLKAADVIVGNRQEPLTCSKLETLVASSKQPVTLKVIRNKQVISVTLKSQ